MADCSKYNECIDLTGGLCRVLRARAMKVTGFGERLCLAVEINGFQITELARKTGYTTGMVSLMMKGKRKPSLKQAVLLAYVLSVSLEWLVLDIMDIE